MPDLTLEILRSIQTRLDRIEGHMNVRFDETNARLAAQAEMFEGRFIGLEHSMLALSARTFDLASRFERVEARFERVEARFERVEARLERVEARLPVTELPRP